MQATRRLPSRVSLGPQGLLAAATLALAPRTAAGAQECTPGGQAELPLAIPDDPAIAGVEIGLQAAVAALFAPGVPVELSTGLVATIAP